MSINMVICGKDSLVIGTDGMAKQSWTTTEEEEKGLPHHIKYNYHTNKMFVIDKRLIVTVAGSTELAPVVKMHVPSLIRDVRKRAGDITDPCAFLHVMYAALYDTLTEEYRDKAQDLSAMKFCYSNKNVISPQANKDSPEIDYPPETSAEILENAELKDEDKVHFTIVEYDHNDHPHLHRIG